MTLPTDPVKWAVDAFRDGRNATYDMYDRYIAGDHPLMFATSKFRNIFGRTFSEFAYNRCEAAVDAHADRMQVTGLAANDNRIAQAAQELWDANRMDVREGEVEKAMFGLADSYVIVELHPDTGDVQYWVQDPRTIRVHWDDTRPGVIDLAAKLWRREDGRAQLNLYYQDRIDKYVSSEKVHGDGLAFVTMIAAGGFRKLTDQSFMLNIGDTVPVFHFPNNGATAGYGISELRSVVPLQNGTNKILMDMFVANEFAAFPQRVLTGVETPPASDKSEDAEAVRRWLRLFEAGIDRILTAPEGSGGFAFPAADMSQYIAEVEFMDKAISRVTRVPVHWLGMTGDFASGRALRIAEVQFTAKLTDRQRAAGYVWSEVSRYGCRLKGMDVKPGEIRVNWQSPESMTRDDVMDNALAMISAGFPFQHVLKEMGYEPEQIESIIELKAQEAERQRALFAAGDVSPFAPQGDAQ